MGTHLPSTEFDGTAVDDQREADAEAVMGEPPAQMVQLLGPDGKLGADPVFTEYAGEAHPRRFFAACTRTWPPSGASTWRQLRCSGRASSRSGFR